MFKGKKNQIDMTEGPLLGKMIRFALPLIFTNLLQLFYNSADMFVVGNFCDDPNALGSVGCTSSIINLILGLMLGLSAGVSVTISQSIGSGDKKRIERAVHTAVLLAIFVGIIIGITGFFLAPALLKLMKTPDVFIEQATLYVQIYFCGTIGNAVFNFCSGILRSRGDSFRPLIFSCVGGVTNVVLNLVFVLVFGMGIEGVAISTIIAQMISAVLSLIYLSKLDDACRVDIKSLRIDRGMFLSFVRVGIPAGVQGMMFSFSNMLLQGSYNSLGPIAVNANTAAVNVDSYIYNVLVAFYHVALNFSSQNFGAKKYGRMWKVFGLNCSCVIAVGLTLGILCTVFSGFLVKIFIAEPQMPEVNEIAVSIDDSSHNIMSEEEALAEYNVMMEDYKETVKQAKSRLLIMGLFYFTCALMDTGTALLRSIGKSMTATVITVFGVCVFRIIWINTVFVKFPVLLALYLVYPVTWLLTFAALALAFVISFKKFLKGEKAAQNAA